MKKNLTLLGGLSVKEFLRDYWQKKPLLIRQAIPDFTGLIKPQQLMSLACTPDTQARLVTHKRGAWQLQQGPFETEDFSGLGKTRWTMLVQGLNHFLPQAAELLKHFNFIPHARLDDLMVSYAPKAGGVGPHFDSYDVFLLQGMGHRRWQISEQKDRTLIEGAPLRILQNFIPENEWILAPGDMLYLPPHWAHNGIAEDDCMTYSIGFRTPSYQELGEQFLIYLQDNLCLDGMYADPDLKTQSHPSEISSDMLRQAEQAINRIKWNKSDIANFLGCYLSEPKAHIFFDPPENPWPLKRFKQVAQTSGITLDLKTQILCHNDTVFINGEAHGADRDDYKILRILADERQLAASTQLPDTVMTLLYQCYTDGYLFPTSNQQMSAP
ncbi:MAG: cupin [Gallionellales bacterium 35-53-114]|jgi:50S ribosomal protein L16 3-hydroxylase|nr:MAG: cupin [Gallionellales bacterium 35-53-114]OYZ65305.1 MAG: cupin [Gallionellales bacterium 24-53-125]OZB08211.1 MAG: cupin [Gallionellales bacterium 39-52-133]HQS58139.1 cupin domain-containing protein [Gallionellaceae bacterium]HQS73694.1 cupin domain-containing protein [Gallionellaceae bacterium]